MNACRAPAPKAEDYHRRQVTLLADRYVTAYSTCFPEAAELLGFALVRHDGIHDNSLTALRAWQETEDELWKQLEKIDGNALIGRPEWITWGVLRDVLESSRILRVSRPELWGVNPVFGWQTIYALIADLQPVGSREARVQALRRYRALPRFIDNEITNLGEGIHSGYTAAQRSVEVVLSQLDGLLSAPLENSPYMGPARRDTDPEFRSAWRKLVAMEIHPAIRRYRDFLRTNYSDKARSSVSIYDNTEGAIGYLALLRSHIGLDIKLENLFREACWNTAENARRMLHIGHLLYGGPEHAGRPGEQALRWLRTKLEQDPRNHFRDAQAIKSFSEMAVQRGREALPRWFRSIPKANVILVPFPDFQQPTAPSGNYVPAPADGGGPAIYQFRIWDPPRLSRAGTEVVIFHETYPGHHLQMAMAAERARSHPITRLVPATAYAEGWAVYCEMLAEEMGLYSSDIDLLGRFSESLDSAAVIDIGMQAMGWSRDRAIQFLADRRVSSSLDRIEAEVDNYLSNPGYIVTYAVAGREIMRLRREAERALGTAFDIREFHERVLENGPIPLWMLKHKIARWILCQKDRVVPPGHR